MNSIIKMILLLLLIGCLKKLPPGYFLFAGIIFFTGFLFLGYLEYKAKRIAIAITCAGVSILLQPFAKPNFLQPTWHLIFEILAALLFIWLLVDLILIERKKSKVTDRVMPY